MDTGSKRAMVAAMVARFWRTCGSSCLPQMASLAPKAIQVLLCGAPSSGITQERPSSDLLLVSPLNHEETGPSQPASSSPLIVSSPDRMNPRRRMVLVSSVVGHEET
ncbi:hypothetical protein JMUB6875_64850 [Nocardia sp. JMUB6875]